MVRSRGLGSVGPISSPDASWTNVRSPSSATVRPDPAPASHSAPMADPIAVDTVPSIPATPRLERTAMPSGFSPTRATSRTGLEAPSTNWSPGRSASTTAAATCNPVASGWAANCARTAALTRVFAAAHRCSQSGCGSPLTSARVPVAVELPDTSGQRGPVVRANTGMVGSASSADTGRCSVGRPHMITCRGRSPVSASGCNGFRAGGAVGSATVGRCARFRCTPAPWPAITTVSGVRSIGTGWSNVTGGATVHGTPPGRPCG